MSDIYLADQEALGRQVAVKVAPSEGADGSWPNGVGAPRDALSRQFEQAARAIALLEHPHILPLYEYGEQHGLHYLVMPYIPDGSLTDLITSGLRQRFPLPLAPALVGAVVRQAADALQFAHDSGVIHRNVKPQNLLTRIIKDAEPSNPLQATTVTATSTTLAPGGAFTLGRLHLWLADFGQAQLNAQSGNRMRSVGAMPYTAPEQWRGYPVPASDQYALACVAYLLLTGHPPFLGELEALYHQHLSVAPQAPTQLLPMLPPAVDGVVLRALAKDPAQRYPRVGEFAAALERIFGPIGSPFAPPAMYGGYGSQSTPVTPPTSTALVVPPPISAQQSPMQPSLQPGQFPINALPSPAGQQHAPPFPYTAAGTGSAIGDKHAGRDPQKRDPSHRDGSPAPLPGTMGGAVLQRWIVAPTAQSADVQALVQAPPRPRGPSVVDRPHKPLRRRPPTVRLAARLGVAVGVVALLLLSAVGVQRLVAIFANSHHTSHPLTATQAPWPSLLTSISMNSPTDGWAIGSHTILRCQQGRWRVFTVRSETLSSIFALPDGEAWAVGDAILHYANGAWTPQQTPISLASSGQKWYLTSIFMLSPTEGWAVAQAGMLQYTNGVWRNLLIGSVQQVNLPPSAIFVYPLGIYAFSDRDLWIVGYATLLHYDGTGWSSMFVANGNASIYNADVLSLSMRSPTDGWAVGSDDSGGLIVHYVNGAWQAQQTAPVLMLNSISTVTAHDGWIVGDNGAILHFDGVTWRAYPSPTGQDLSSVYVQPDPDGVVANDIGWATGVDGSLLQLSGGVWHIVHGGGTS